MKELHPHTHTAIDVERKGDVLSLSLSGTPILQKRGKRICADCLQVFVCLGIHPSRVLFLPIPFRSSEEQDGRELSSLAIQTSDSRLNCRKWCDSGEKWEIFHLYGGGRCDS